MFEVQQMKVIECKLQKLQTMCNYLKNRDKHNNSIRYNNFAQNTLGNFVTRQAN